MNASPKYVTVKKWMIQMLGVFNKILRESTEMLYQNDSDYLFDSTKFEKAYNFSPTTYEEGIRLTVESMR